MKAVDVRNVCKEKVIKEFNYLLKRMSLGHYEDDYQHILNLIAFIDSFEYLDNLTSLFEKLMEDGRSL